ncbi:MAG: hypothetical protein M1457_06085, partial [bacterium]|nr:hypothetical protein [bacterium]
MNRSTKHATGGWAAGCLLALCLLAGQTEVPAQETAAPAKTAEGRASAPVPEDVYKGDLVAYPNVWGLRIGRTSILLTSDDQLKALAYPDKPFDPENPERTLRTTCESAQRGGVRTLVILFDQFFAQYRPGQTVPRALTPDMDEYIAIMAKVNKFAQGYGLGLELSLLNPLEIGPGYRKQTGESGRWLHYRKGVRDPKTGAFSVQLWQQRRWENNKGVFAVEDAGVRVFAFKETPIRNTPYRVVDPKDIVEITPLAKMEILSDPSPEGGHYYARQVRVYGTGQPQGAGADGLDRVCVVQQYNTPEMDYFSDKAYPFLTGMIDKYKAAGVKLTGFYSDEMHIQQDWSYHGHHDNGEFALRYVSDGLAREYARRWGAQYQDFAKYMIYFLHGQEDASNSVDAKEEVMEVFGDTPEAIRETALFRTRYFHLLQDGVVDLCARAKRHAESIYGWKMESTAHATWAESPTCDVFRAGRGNSYDYTSTFIWSNTVQQAASACHDYFKWGDYLTGGGNDTAEGGWIDRDYYALALAASTGIINEYPNAYAAAWGAPYDVLSRRSALADAFGDRASEGFAIVENKEHRDVSVLMLYPLDLVSVDERFGSWMTQYGYANMITAEKLLELGKVDKDAIVMAGRRFTTLVTTFEPFPKQALLDMMKQFAEGGGRLIWAGPPPVLTYEGKPALEVWQGLFGVDYKPGADEGERAPGRMVRFEGPLAKVKSEVILTDYLVDHVYPVTPREGTTVAGRIQDNVVATQRAAGAGTAVFLGFRPRDDQSQSLGYETRQWFEILDALGAYPPSGKFPGANDNTEHVSRTTEVLACRFPNGAVAMAPHFRTFEERWPGGFRRDRAADEAVMAKYPPPSKELRLKDFK